MTRDFIELYAFISNEKWYIMNAASIYYPLGQKPEDCHQKVSLHEQWRSQGGGGGSLKKYN